MTTKETTSPVSIDTADLLGIVFVTLKLCGVIDWSWWWVTAPFWIQIAIPLVAISVALLVFGAMALGVGAMTLFLKLKSLAGVAQR